MREVRATRAAERSHAGARRSACGNGCCHALWGHQNYRFPVHPKSRPQPEHAMRAMTVLQGDRVHASGFLHSDYSANPPCCHLFNN